MDDGVPGVKGGNGSFGAPISAQPWWYQGLVDVFRSPPTTVTAVFLTLCFAKCGMGIDLSRLTSVTKDGVTFATKDDLVKTNAEIQQTKVAIQESSTRVSKKTAVAAADVLTQVQDLDRRLKDLAGGRKAPGKETTAEMVADLKSASEVSDAVAALSVPDPGQKGPVAGIEGYIWIGTRNSPKGKLSPQNVGGLADPDTAKVGQQFKVLGNLVVRQSFPADTSRYYHSSKLVGVAPQGATVVIQEEPRSVQRGASDVYWMRIRVAQ